MYGRETLPHPTFMVNRPPRPPCWQDFVPKAKNNNNKSRNNGPAFTDLSTIPHSPVAVRRDVAKTHSGHTGGKHRKSKHKLHRTRSQTHIENEDLPEQSMAVSLACTKPREFKILKNPVDLDENARRCHEWVKSVQACEPLDDVAFTKGTGVDVEVPDEQWDRNRQIRPPQNSSASSSDIDDLPHQVKLRGGRDRAYYEKPQTSKCQSRQDADRDTSKTDRCDASNKENQEDENSGVKVSSSFESNLETRDPGGSSSSDNDKYESCDAFYVEACDIHLEKT